MADGIGGALQDLLGTKNDYQFNVGGPNAQAFVDPNAARNRQMLLQGAQAQQGTAQQVGAGYLDPSQQYQQAQQNLLAQSLQNTAAGIGPSVAQAQMQAGLNRAEASQAAAAGSLGAGVNPFLAARQLATQGAEAQQNTLAQAAMARAQEAATAQGQLGNVLGQNRAQTQNMAQFAAQQQMQAALANQGAGLNQQQINNQASQYATSGALGIDQNSFAAQQDQERMRMQNEQFNAQGNSGIAAANQANANQLTGAALGAIGGAATTFLNPVGTVAGQALQKKMGG